MATQSVVSIVDDDESIRESLPDLLRHFGFGSQTFASAEEFLVSDRADLTAILILDVALPGMTGPELRRELVRQGRALPTVFITAHETETEKLSTPERRDVRVLLKPFSDTSLLDALNEVSSHGGRNAAR